MSSFSPLLFFTFLFSTLLLGYIVHELYLDDDVSFSSSFSSTMDRGDVLMGELVVAGTYVCW